MHTRPVVSLSLSLFAACGTLPPGSGRLVTEERSVPAFTKVRVDSGLTATVTIGSPSHVQVTGDDNLIDHILTRVVGAELVAELPRGETVENRATLHVDIGVPALSSLAAEGAAVVDATGLEGPSLDLIASGAGIITASGAANHLVIDASGASTVLVTPVTAVDVVATASGASKVELCSSGMLELHLSGASHATYRCHPQSVTQDLTGASTAQAE